VQQLGIRNNSDIAKVHNKFTADFRHAGGTGVPRGISGFKLPTLKVRNFFRCAFAQEYLSHSLNHKFYSRKRYKLYTDFTFGFSFWRISSFRPLTGAVPIGPHGELPSFRSPGSAIFEKFPDLLPINVNPSVVKSWVLLWLDVSQFLESGAGVFPAGRE